jgi:hypothetical protein
MTFELPDPPRERRLPSFEIFDRILSHADIATQRICMHRPQLGYRFYGASLPRRVRHN